MISGETAASRRGLERWVGWALGMAVLFYALVLVHDFFQYIGSFPYVATDDGMANTSYGLATQGRYAFLSSPIINNWVQRVHGIHNYGPWYFWLGAGLVWVFGYSLSLMRFMHLGLVGAAAALAVLDKKQVRVGGVCTAVLLLWMFDKSHWPMVRPDVMAMFFVALTLYFLGKALRRGAWPAWFMAGMCAAAAAFSHMLVVAVVAAAGVVGIAGAVMDSRGVGLARRAAAPVLGLVAGGMASVLQFWVASGFRAGDFIFQLSSYHKHVTHVTLSPWGRLARHWEVAFFRLGDPQWWAWLVLAGVLLGVGGLVCALRFRRAGARRVAALLLPVLSLLVLHLISRMFYNNYHENYSLIIHLAVAWLFGAVAASAGVLLEGWSPSWARGYRMGAALGVGLLAVQLALVSLSTQGYRGDTARKWVDIADFIKFSLLDIPRGSTAWGNVFFGVETPDRIQLVHYEDAVLMAGVMKHEARAAVAPEYLVWGTSERAKLVTAALRPEQADYIDPARLLGVRYEPISLTAAEPYGVTRVYRRVVGETAERPVSPAVRVYRNTTGQWGQSLGVPIKAQWRPDAAVTFDVPKYFSFSGRGRADGSVVSQLPPGDYLLRCEIDESGAVGPSGFRLLAATSDRTIEDAIPTERGPEFDIMFLHEGLNVGWLLLRHPGGEAWVSHFGLARGAGVGRIEVYPVDYLTRGDLRAGFDALLEVAPEAWDVTAGDGGKNVLGDGALIIEGDSSAYGYQAVSAPFSVPRGTTLLVRLDVQSLAGDVAVGVLDQQGQWLIPASAFSREIRFATGDNESVRIVLANTRGKAGEGERSRFRLGKVRIDARRDDLYADTFVETAFDPANWRTEEPLDAVHEIRGLWQ